MSSYCYVQDCVQNCCNIDGICPIAVGNQYQTNCYYFYNWYWNVWNYWWIYFAIVAGSILFITILIACCAACVRRRRRFNQDTIIINSQPMPSYAYGNSNIISANTYEMNTTRSGQPILGEPVYLVGAQNVGLRTQQDTIYV